MNATDPIPTENLPAGSAPAGLEHGIPPGIRPHSFIAGEVRRDASILAKLNDDEAASLAKCEVAIHHGLRSLLEVGTSLAEIRDRRLYRADFDTFAEYCEARWDLGARQVYRLCDAAEIVANLQASGPLAIQPANERQCRPLSELPTEHRRGAWDAAVASAGCGVVTARHVAEAVQARKIELGLATAPSPALAKPVPAPVIDVKSVGDREEQLREATDRAIASVLVLQDLMGTAGSFTSAQAIEGTLVNLEKLKEHLKRVERPRVHEFVSPHSKHREGAKE